MRGSSWVVVASFTAAFALAGGARAGDIDAELRALFVRGNALYDAGKPVEAEAVLEQAWALRHTYDVAINLAQVEMAQKKWLEAIEHLRFGMDQAPAGVSTKRRRQYQDLYTSVLSHVGLLAPLVEPAGASVAVEGASVLLPEGIAVEPGEHRVSVTKPGFAAKTVSAAAKAGERVEVRVQLDVEPPAAPHGSTPQPPLPPLNTAPKTPERSWLAPGVVGGAGLVLLGSAVGLTVVSNGAADDAAAEHTRLEAARVKCAGDGGACDTLRAHADTRDATHTAAAWLYVGGGLAIGAAVVLLVLPPAEVEREPAVTGVLPWIGAEGAGMTWSGRF